MTATIADPVNASVHCPVCGRRAVFTAALNRFSHCDGSENAPCWNRLSGWGRSAHLYSWRSGEPLTLGRLCGLPDETDDGAECTDPTDATEATT